MPNPFDSQYADIRKTITYYAQRYGIDPNLAIWQLWTENNFRASGCSNKGACGIAQFTPATAQRFGVNRENVNSSLDGYGKYMSYLRKFFNGNMTKAVAAYNAGEGAIAAGRYPAETRDYLKKIYDGMNGVVSNGVIGVGNIAANPSSFDFSQYMGVSVIGEKNRYLVAFAILAIIFIFAFN